MYIYIYYINVYTYSSIIAGHWWSRKRVYTSSRRYYPYYDLRPPSCVCQTLLFGHTHGLSLKKIYYISVESITRQPTGWIIIICVSLLWRLSDSAAATFRVNEEHLYTEGRVEVCVKYSWPMKSSSSERETKNIKQIT